MLVSGERRKATNATMMKMNAGMGWSGTSVPAATIAKPCESLDLSAVIVHIATGSNLGQRTAHLDRADAELGHLGRVLRVSPTYATAAVGMPPGTPDFLNRVVEVELMPPWADDPEATMKALLDIERDMGRTRESGMVASRPIDLDIVLWGDRELNRPGLVVPHPRMLDRRFVLQPLADLMPEGVIPGTGRTVAECLCTLPDGVPDIAPWPNP